MQAFRQNKYVLIWIQGRSGRMFTVIFQIFSFFYHLLFKHTTEEKYFKIPYHSNLKLSTTHIEEFQHLHYGMFMYVKY